MAVDATATYVATPQAPIHSGFGPQTTASDVLHGLDLRGTIAIVTGGYSGIGLETTRALAEADFASRIWRLSEQLTGTTFVH
jgi:hypothetical protein